jgi:SAM-dependent methyltransferase
MNENPAASDWVAARGEKWLAQLSGMEPTLRPVDEPLLRALRLDAPCRIADIGCGGGSTTLELARRAPAGSGVHGFDISPALVEAARQRAAAEGATVTFEVADMATAAPPQPYDRLVSRFGVMFFSEPQAAFTNLARWLAPGGRFAFAVWGRPSDNLWITTVRGVVAEIIDLPPPDPEAPGPFRYGEVDRLLALLERAGLGELDSHDWRGALPIGGGLSPEQSADFALSSFSAFGEQLAAAGEEARREARRTLTARLSPHHRDGAVWMDACVHIVTGTQRAG